MMDHPTRLYLLHRAHLLKQYEDQAQARGEVFHAAEVFTPLDAPYSSVEVQLRIQVLKPGKAPHLVLVVRHPLAEDRAEVAVKVASILLEKDITRVTPPRDEGGRRYHVFYTPHVPATLLPLGV